jgi:hypothetical protein
LHIVFDSASQSGNLLASALSTMTLDVNKPATSTRIKKHAKKNKEEKRYGSMDVTCENVREGGEAAKTKKRKAEVLEAGEDLERLSKKERKRLRKLAKEKAEEVTVPQEDYDMVTEREKKEKTHNFQEYVRPFTTEVSLK